MKGYTFYFIRPTAGVHDFDFADCRDDEDAFQMALRLLEKHTTADSVEVFNGESIVGVASRSESRVGRALRSMRVPPTPST